LADAIAVKAKFVAQFGLYQTYLAHLHIVNNGEYSPEDNRPILNLKVGRLDTVDLYIFCRIFTVVGCTPSDPTCAAEVFHRGTMFKQTVKVLWQKPISPPSRFA
jgi:hypothetical protein